MLKVFCYAKINLVLEVLGKRTDGYHELCMVMQSVSLADVLSISRTDLPGITISMNRAVTAAPEENIVYKAAQLIMTKFPGITGVNISIEKNIPVAAGLAGGSADCAGTLAGMNKLFELGMTAAEMEELGNKLGSDIAFCLHGGIKLAQGRGELITPLPELPLLNGIILKPPFPLSTAEIYKLVPNLHKKASNNELIDSYRKRNVNEANIQNYVVNDLYPLALQRRPELKEYLDTVRSTDPLVSQMSGSGPSIFALYDSIEKRDEALCSLSKYEVFPFSTISCGWDIVI